MRPDCEITHRLLISGGCPWCEQPISDGQPRPDLMLPAAVPRRWDTAATLRTLDDDNIEVRTTVVSNFHFGGTQPQDALPALRKALGDSVQRVRWLATCSLSRLGGHLKTQDLA